MLILQPAMWVRPKGYANGVVSTGRMIFLAGQIGWDAQGIFQSDDFVAQLRQALLNVRTLLAEVGAGPQHIVRMNWYLLDKQEYKARRAEVGEMYREILGRHYPAMTVVQVSGFIEEGAKLEIEVTAMLPE